MQKFKSVFCPPINVKADYAKKAAEQAREIQMRDNPEFTLWAIKDGALYRKMPKHYTGVINLKPAGGKWEKYETPKTTESRYRLHESNEAFLSRIGAVEADFKGGPRA